MGQHCLRFPKVLYFALLRLSYNGDAPILCCRLSMAHGLDMCEASVMISFDLTRPWSGFIIGTETDTALKMMAHVALTSLCEDCIAATAAMPIMLLSIQNQENPAWQQRLEAMSNLECPHFSAVIASLARYS
jgi:hypothetical protein